MNRFVSPRSPARRVPLTVVGGPSGAGKTTLLRQLLTRNDGRRIAALLEHPDALALSDSEVASADGDALVLRNGSVCLGLDGDILTGLPLVHRGDPSRLPDHVVVEVSHPTGHLHALGYEYMPGFRPGGAVMVLGAPDVEHVRAGGAEEQSALEAQLRHVDLLVLNQVDRVRTSARPALRRWLQERAPGARLVECEHGHVPTPLVLGSTPPYLPAHAICGEWSCAYTVDADPRRTKAVEPRHDEDYRAWLLTTHHTVDTNAFGRWVNALPRSVLHGEGVLRVRNERDHRVRFHLCGSRWSLTSETSSDHAPEEPVGWLSLIGLAPAPRPSAARAADASQLVGSPS
ncbi:MAG: CobW family GTP-binding protein [Gemmatimonadaceae bacterium]